MISHRMSPSSGPVSAMSSRHRSGNLPSRPPGPLLLDADGCRALADALVEAPDTVISKHILRRGLARAWVLGNATRLEAAIIQNLAFCQDELIGFGDDAEALWSILRSRRGWSCVLVDSAVVNRLGPMIGSSAERPARTLVDIYHVLERPPPPLPSAPVRILTATDEPLVLRAPGTIWSGGYPSAAALLSEGIAAAAIVGDEIVAMAHTAAQSAAYADIGVATLPPWRGRGFATAAAALVVQQVQATGKTPTWSTGATNAASLKVAATLGFVETTRRVYVIQ